MTPPSWLMAIGTLAEEVPDWETLDRCWPEVRDQWYDQLDALADLLTEHARQRRASQLQDLDAVFAQLKAAGWGSGRLG